MTDDQFTAEAKRLSDLGAEGLQALREHLKGQMPRLIELACRGVSPTKKPAPRPRKAKDEPEGFAEWYAVYPRHVARDAAAAAYGRAVKRVSAEVLLAGARRYRAECAGTEAHYVAHPASWLNAGRWADEPAKLALVPSAGAQDVTPEQWANRLRVFDGLAGEPRGSWTPKWGPPPDDPGCWVPADLLSSRKRQSSRPRL